jgi:hypothetical protein
VHEEHRLRWVLILACVALAVFFGLACALDSDGDIGATPFLADGCLSSPVEVFLALSASDTLLSPAASSARIGLVAPGSPAAVRGGLRLLD